MKIGLPHVVRDTDRYGTVRVYVRVKGQKKVKLASAPGSPEFLAEYNEAVAKLKTGKPQKSDVGTLRWLVREFEASHRFQKVAMREQRRRHQLVQSALDEPIKPGANILFGECPLKFFDAKCVRVIRDRKMKTPSASTHRLKNLRLIFNWALEERPEHVTVNPLIGVKMLETGNLDGWHTWTEDEIAKFEAKFKVGTQARLALDLMLYTGARRADVVLLGPKSLIQVKNPDTNKVETWLEFKPGKTSKSTGNVVRLPLLPELRESISATVHGIDAFLINAHGAPHASGDSFANWFKDRTREAGLPENCSPHGLRKAGACRAADNGATEKQMMALFGWSSSKLATHYSKKASDMKLAYGSVHTLSKA